ncbi:hypothetical protein DRO27_03740 [Candidatus Bathyarchaeota archaeon]|nr:MAG: hypothetical protein DRO27_03740 [Candidatus Bathyarchaeota archaeon]
MVEVTKIEAEIDEGLIELIKTLENESNDNPRVIDRILLESINESIKTVFGDELAPILLSSLSIAPANMGTRFDAQKFLVRLNETLKGDAFHIQKMIEGKMLAKHHCSELRKKIALPRLDNF